MKCGLLDEATNNNLGRDGDGGLPARDGIAKTARAFWMPPATGEFTAPPRLFVPAHSHRVGHSQQMDPAAHPEIRQPTMKSVLPHLIFFRAAMLASLLLGALAARCATTNVSYGFYYFDPPVVTIEPGDTVNWDSSSPFHTLAGTDGGTDPDDVICGGASLPCAHAFTTPGTYTYECTSHYYYGMTGAVIVTSVTLPPPPPPTQAVLTNGGFNGSGHFKFTVTTPANQTNIVQAATNLFSGIWVSLDTNGTGGSYVFTDTNAPSFPLRFYRVISPP